MDVKLKISEETFFNNGRIILDSLTGIEDEIRGALSKQIDVELINRKNKGEGITARSLNEALRKCLENGSFRGETHVENGIFFSKSKEGFDFASFDEHYNLAKLYNYYMGTIGILNGNEKILDLYNKMGLSKTDWSKKVKDMMSKTDINNDFECEKKSLTVVGEFQFGNWALVYRDLFRLLGAANNPGVDMYIYVAADDNLSRHLSDQIVTYKKAVKVIEEYLSIIKTPVWVVSLGIYNN